MREARCFGEGAILDGILLETRVFGELIPLIVCSTALILEKLLAARIHASVNNMGTGMPAPTLQPQVVGTGSEEHDRAA